jgi:hypothetical protein
MAANFDPNTTPALAPPEGVIPNLINQYTRQPILIGTATACLTLTTLCIAIRIYTKIRILKSLNIEDGECSYLHQLDYSMDLRYNW